MAEPVETEVDLKQYLRILRLHWKLLVLFPLLFGIPTLISVQQRPNIYRATVRLIVETETPKVVELKGVEAPAAWYGLFLNTELQIMVSPPVLKGVIEELHLTAFAPFSGAEDPVALLRGMVKAQSLENTKFIDIVATAPKPELVARIANSLADNYARYNLERKRALQLGGMEWLREEVTKAEERLRQTNLALQHFLEEHSDVEFGGELYDTSIKRLEALADTITEIRGQRIEAEIRYRPQHPLVRELIAKEEEFQRAFFEQEKKVLQLNRLTLQFNELQREMKMSDGLYAILLGRLKELDISGGLLINNVQVSEYAKVPRSPIGPNRGQSVLFSIVFGLMVGGGLGIGLELLKKTIRDRQQFEQILEIPFLGSLPYVGGGGKGRAKREEKVAFFEGTEALSFPPDSIRSIRTTLEFLLPVDRPQALLITSALPEEGKSIVSINLAVSLSELSRRVLLIEADLRRPSFHDKLKINLEPGLSGYLEGKAALEELVQTVNVGQGLSVIPAGVTPAQPADLLASPKMAQLLQTLRGQYRYLLIDTPPILAVADCSILATLVDGVLYVIWAGQTPQEVASMAKRRLLDVGGKFTGGILNKSRPEMEGYPNYRYAYYYRKPGSPSSPDLGSP